MQLAGDPGALGGRRGLGRVGGALAQLDHELAAGADVGPEQPGGDDDHVPAEAVEHLGDRGVLRVVELADRGRPRGWRTGPPPPPAGCRAPRPSTTAAPPGAASRCPPTYRPSTPARRALRCRRRTPVRAGYAGPAPRARRPGRSPRPPSAARRRWCRRARARSRPPGRAPPPRRSARRRGGRCPPAGTWQHGRPQAASASRPAEAGGLILEDERVRPRSRRPRRAREPTVVAP